ncbi:RraA family protein [Ruegeria atlantica]|uniref:Putative 4-hydroxy-4-methyl-2-oxoglutarate aldolase n=1 Tax=Ruegeria atlantica TaxID=81569 RepID=A0A0N7LNU3_9RHOB|nr:RraA family protein [Ruegeria atlantica]CUH43380.1 bifunctional hexulose-6-phosphate synthase/ribonuclease regulator [Ruegeria atlantica]
MTPSLLSLLRKVDTPTVCNAVEVAQGKRGFDDFTRGTMLCSAPEEPPIVGYARTAKIAAVNPPTEPPEVIKTRRMAYYKYMAEAANPCVAVIEDLDYPDCIGAYWGEINTSVHKGFGISGVVTNGVMRDLGDLPKGFPVVAGSVGPSHGFVHVREIDTPVSVFGLTVNPGELVHADRHGALVVPSDVVDQLEAAIQKLLVTERIVLDAARQPEFDFDAFETAWAVFEKARV